MKLAHLFAVLGLLTASSCASLLDGLRSDLNEQKVYEQPTVGGQFPEGRWLDETGSERGIASQSPTYYGKQAANEPWVSEAQQAANMRNSMRVPHVNEDGMPISYQDTQNFIPGVKRQYKNGFRATAEDFEDNSQSTGSLWASNGQTNYFLTKNRVRGVGDIITVKVSDELVNDTALEVKKTLTTEEMATEIEETKKKKYDELLAAQNDKKPTRKPAAKDGAKVEEEEVPEIEVPELTLADIDVKPNMKMAAGDVMMAEILERFPNGNYKIRATKKVPYKGTTRMLTMVGIARHADISDDDTIEAGKLYEYRIKVYR